MNWRDIAFFLLFFFFFFFLLLEKLRSRMAVLIAPLFDQSQKLVQNNKVQFLPVPELLDSNSIMSINY